MMGLDQRLPQAYNNHGGGTHVLGEFLVTDLLTVAGLGE